MNDATDELAALRNLLAEALSPEPDAKVSAGAVELRRKFSDAAMTRLDCVIWKRGEKHEEREG